VNTGFHFSNVYNHVETRPDRAVKSDLKSGFHGGIQFEIPVNEKFSLLPGVSYSKMGYANADGVRLNTKADYLEMPFDILYKLKTDDGGHVLFGVGAYLAYGLGGKWNVPEKSGVNGWPSMNGKLVFRNVVSHDEYNNVSFNSNFVYGKPLDYGANALIGYQFKYGLFFRFEGQLGLRNLSSAVENLKMATEMKNFRVGFSLGYMF